MIMAEKLWKQISWCLSWHIQVRQCVYVCVLLIYLLLPVGLTLRSSSSTVMSASADRVVTLQHLDMNEWMKLNTATRKLNCDGEREHVTLEFDWLWSGGVEPAELLCHCGNTMESFFRKGEAHPPWLPVTEVCSTTTTTVQGAAVGSLSLRDWNTVKNNHYSAKKLGLHINLHISLCLTCLNLIV